MIKTSVIRRALLAAGVLGGAGATLAWLGDERSSAAPARQPGPPLRPFAPEGPRLVLDPEHWPKVLHEAPQLAELVRAGRLPPVADRVGLDPLVLQPLHETGRYGGTLRRAFTGPGDSVGPSRFASGPDSLLYWDADWKQVVPNIARGYELSRDGRTLTLFLRRGMRWSDGAPFTADDIMFWYEDMNNDDRILARPTPTLMMGDEPVRIERIDAATVQYISPRPNFVLLEMLAGWSDLSGPSILGRAGMGGFAPKHYLSRFHAKYVDEAQLKAAAREAGYVNWSIMLKTRNDWTLNPDLPVVSPWRVVKPINEESFVLERNPYSIWVDTEGQQLPYIDQLHHIYCSGTDAVNFKAGTGGLDEQDRNLTLSGLSFLLANRRRSGYEVYVDPLEVTDLGLRINLDYRIDPVIGALLKSRDFRRALSLGVDREAINETLMQGSGIPSAAVPSRQNRYYPGDSWARRWAVLDLVQANQLLDKVGLKARDSAGFRLRPDGRGRLRLACQVTTGHFDYMPVAEMVREQWASIGIDLDARLVEPSLSSQQTAAGEVQLVLSYTGADDPFVQPDSLFPSVPINVAAASGPEYARWFQSSGKAGRRPPPEIQEIMDLWRKGREAPLAERIPIGQEMIRRHVDEVLSIGIVSNGFTFNGVRVASRSLGNVPRRVINSHVLRSPVNGFPMTHYFRDPERT